MHVISILHIDPAYTLYWQNGEKPTDAKQKNQLDTSGFQDLILGSI